MNRIETALVKIAHYLLAPNLDPELHREMQLAYDHWQKNKSADPSARESRSPVAAEERIALPRT